MISVIHEHSVDLDLLRKGANILDLGARGFAFTKYFDARGDFVVPVDMDPGLNTDRPYLKYAVTNYCGVANIKRTNDPQATSIGKIITGETVEAITLEKLCEVVQVPFFDLLKMDVEMSEEQIILSLKKPPAHQVTIEFHKHLGQTEIAVKMMVAHLNKLGYKTALHELTNQHGAGFNYWSSLFILGNGKMERN